MGTCYDPIYRFPDWNKLYRYVAVSCGYGTCFAVRACDGLCHLTKLMDRVETPFGFQSIVWTFVRHTVGRCLIFSALPEVARVTIGFLRFLPMCQHGLCFGCCFSGPLPLRSLTNGPPIGVRFWESLVIRLYSEIDQIHLSIEAQSDTACLPMGDCHKIYHLQLIMSKMNFQGAMVMSQERERVNIHLCAWMRYF